MLTLRNEPDDGLVITLARLHDVEGHAPTVPAGELVRIVGVGVDEAAVLWAVAWHGQEYFCMPEELRPPRINELQALQDA